MQTKSVFRSVLLLAVFIAGTCGARPACAAVASPVYRVAFATSAGTFVVRVDRRQAPLGADRLYRLVAAHFFDGARFYRVVPGFVVQWGYPADPARNAAWTGSLPDDPVRGSNLRGTLTFAATAAPNSRTTQLFVNEADNARLDALGFAPIGRVVNGMQVVDHLFAGYGEAPDQSELARRGNAYVKAQYPKLDYIIKAKILPP